MVDCADATKLEICTNELHDLLKEERLSGASLLVLANKQDLAGALSGEQIEQLLNLKAIKTHNWALYPVSAVKDYGVMEPFEWLVEDIGNRIYA